MTAAMRITLLAVAAMAVFSTASAVTYDVGGPAGQWDLSTNYANWVSDKQFLPGDSIVFKYTPQTHDVLEVSKADYDSCNIASPINPALTTGNDAVSLSAPGTRYFICGIGNHCNNGMKVTIDVVSASAPSPPAPASGPSASNSPPPSPPAPAGVPSDSNSPPPPQTPSAATSVRATAGLGLVVLLAGLMA